MNQDATAARVWEAVGLWADGRRGEAMRELADLTEAQTLPEMYGVACGLAVVAQAALTQMHGLQPGAAFWGVRTPHGASPEDVLTAEQLFTARFIAAFLNSDTDTTMALFVSAYTSPDPALLPACLGTMLAATGEAVGELTRGGRR
ncbi:hypothetical protein [Streptomyces sp. MNP-20]|uniref:hypothetical protein n=1 Tax=Streptomyces sp. MNP-20 TaxID=2721165 RepID=UPI0015525B9E|nr:hypothetical protein [Streptomyces sp. MNP-20]